MSSASAAIVTGARRSQAEASLSAHLPPPFMVLPPTTRFPHLAVAHGELGLCAVVVHDEVIMHDEDGQVWWGVSSTVDPARMAAEAALDLAAAARAPADRVTGITWLPNGLSHVPPPEGIVAGPDPELAAYMAQSVMQRRLVGSHDPLTPWLGAYVQGALGPDDPTPRHMRRLLQLIERCLVAEFEDRPAVIEGCEIPPHDFCDPRFLLPAILACAHEDLALLNSAPQAPGAKVAARPAFRLDLAQDPGAFLGYRVAAVTPAHPFFVLNPVVALVRRFRYYDEYLFADLLGQFGRYLHKNGLDSLVVTQAQDQLRVQGDEARGEQG